MATSFVTVGGIPLTNTVFAFLRADGTPEYIQREIKLVERPGINDFGAYLGALSAGEFSLTTEAIAGSLAAAKALQASYLAAQSTTVDLWWQDTFVSTVLILNVQNFACTRFQAGVPAAGANAKTVWRLRGTA